MSYNSDSIDPATYPRLARAVDAIAAGRPVLLLDDSDRENEADIVCAAQNMSVDTMVKMIRDGSGIVCLCLDGASTDRLGLEPMVSDNRARNRTGFTVTIEARHGVTTGVSAPDRLATIRAALDSLDGNSKIVSPGHVFPLRARDGGVLERRGHTEGSMDLAILAGLGPAAVLCELMNDDGSMARDADIRAYSARHDMPMLSIEDIALFRRARAEKCA